MTVCHFLKGGSCRKDNYNVGGHGPSESFETSDNPASRRPSPTRRPPPSPPAEVPLFPLQNGEDYVITYEKTTKENSEVFKEETVVASVFGQLKKRSLNNLSVESYSLTFNRKNSRGEIEVGYLILYRHDNSNIFVSGITRNAGTTVFKVSSIYLKIGGGGKKNYKNCTVVELKEKASKNKIVGYSKMNKATLVKALSP